MLVILELYSERNLSKVIGASKSCPETTNQGSSKKQSVYLRMEGELHHIFWKMGSLVALTVFGYLMKTYLGWQCPDLLGTS